MSLKEKKITADIVFNLVSIGVMGISGIAANVIIGAFYGSEALGIFNQIYAIYIFLSQLAVMGLPPSVTKYVAEYSHDPHECKKIIFSAIIMACLISPVFSTLIWIGHEFIGTLLSSNGVSEGLIWAGPGLFLFAVNKVFLASVNGLQWMKLYAVLQSMRYLLILLCLVTLTLLGWPGNSLSLTFTISEGILFVLCLFFLRPYFVAEIKGMRFWINKHFTFGVKSFFNALLLELNTRVDVLMLGLFYSDAIVGVYSFAAMLAEGLFQLLAAVMRVVTPRLVQYWAKQEIKELSLFARQVIRKSYGFSIIGGGILILSYPMWIKLLTNRIEFQDTWIIFSIISTGIILASGYIPLRNLLQAAGLPGFQTLQTVFLVMVNIIGNVVFIPAYGMNGAALGTAISIFSVVFILKGMTFRLLSLKV